MSRKEIVNAICGRVISLSETQMTYFDKGLIKQVSGGFNESFAWDRSNLYKLNQDALMNVYEGKVLPTHATR